MSTATATTTAKAVRQHGGGMVHATLPRDALRGRQQCPSGGVKKSLCCAAAGINALDLPATTPRAYPMTGVRPARKPSTSLRLSTRPPAQLVVGYKPAISSELKLKDHNKLAMNRGVSLRKLIEVAPSIITMSLHVQSKSGEFHPQACNIKILIGKHPNNAGKINTNFPNDINPLRIKIIVKILCETHQHRLVLNTDIRGESLESWSLPRQIIKTQTDPMHSAPESRGHSHFRLKRLLSLPFQLLFSLRVSNPNGGQDCAYRADSLYPGSSSILDAKMAKHYKQRPAQNTNRNEPPNHPDRCQLHAVRYHEPRHMQWLLAIQFPGSLKVSGIRVQRGTA